MEGYTAFWFMPLLRELRTPPPVEGKLPDIKIEIIVHLLEWADPWRERTVAFNFRWTPDMTICSLEKSGVEFIYNVL